MGDIIAGFFLTLMTLGVYGVYKVVTSKMPERRSFIGFFSLLLLVGGVIGVLLTFFNKNLLEYYPIVYALTLLFFTTQSIASYLYLKFPKVALPILLFTLLIQIPIIHSKSVSYRSQTLLSFNVNNYHSKTFDIEPGSYTSFHSGRPTEFSLGINLIPILTIIIFLRERKRINQK